jgi:hypothetical protein
MLKTAIAGAALLTVSGCATAPRPIEVQIKTIEVPVRAPCPAPAERARLKTLRPVPLRSAVMPPTVAERVAKAFAQLGLYEAKGAFADQVDAALDRCQEGTPPK